MDYLIDDTINLTAIAAAYKRNGLAIRRALQQHGLTWAVANRFTMFALYGFHGPNQKRTLNDDCYLRLGVRNFPRVNHPKGGAN